MARELPKPYRLADRTIKELTSLIQKSVDRKKQRLSILSFDELNVMTEVDVLYSEIANACWEKFWDLYRDRYRELWLYLKGVELDDDIIDEMVEMYLAGLWEKPNESTHYAFEAELIRKRDRAKEAIISVPTKTQKQLELEKASRYVIQQIGFYVDIIEDEASLQCLRDAGVKRVRWNVYGDDRVCDECLSMNGNVYEIGKVPDKPHLRCRCYLTPVN